MNSKKYEIDMTNGPLMGKLITFCVPLMLSGILQLLFNAADLVVVGRFTGSDALAAVGATSALINMLTNLFIGVSIGVNVAAAKAFARSDAEAMDRTVHTAITFAVISGGAAMAVGLILARPILQLMGTPEGVIDLSALYMRIYFCGMLFFMLYNYGAAVLRAVGDTRRPLIFLIISGILNVFLNLLLVIVFDLGVAGVAIATVFSQMVSCVLVLICLLKSDGMYRLDLRRLRISLPVLKSMLIIGLPAGIQSVIISFSNVLLQSSVNSFGEAAMAGYTAECNLTGFMYVTVNAISQSCLTFSSQNLGAGKPPRIKRVVLYCVGLEVVISLALGIGVYMLGHAIISIYTSSEAAIAAAIQIMPMTLIPYFFCGVMDCMTGALRGLGRSTAPMLLTVIGTVGVRIFWIFLIFPLNRTLTFLFVSYPLSWICTIVMQVTCYLIVWKKDFSSGRSSFSAV